MSSSNSISSSSSSSPSSMNNMEPRNNELIAQSGRTYACRRCNRTFTTSMAMGGHQNAHRRELDEEKRRALNMTSGASSMAWAAHRPGPRVNSSSITRSGSSFSWGYLEDLIDAKRRRTMIPAYQSAPFPRLPSPAQAPPSAADLFFRPVARHPPLSAAALFPLQQVARPPTPSAAVLFPLGPVAQPPHPSATLAPLGPIARPPPLSTALAPLQTVSQPPPPSTSLAPLPQTSLAPSTRFFGVSDFFRPSVAPTTPLGDGASSSGGVIVDDNLEEEEEEEEEEDLDLDLKL